MSRSVKHHITANSYWLFGHLLAFCSFAYFILGLLYAERLQVISTSVVVVLSLVQANVSKYLLPKANELLSYGLSLLAFSAACLAMPQGAARGTVFIIFCIGVSIFSTRNLYSYLVTLIGVALFFFMPFVKGSDYLVPAKVIIGTSMTMYAFLAMLFVGRERKRAMRASKSLISTKLLMSAKEKQIKKQSIAFEKVNERFKEQTKILEKQLEISHQSTAILSDQQKDEAHLVQAIHHDLREPLRSIISFSQLIKRRVKADPQSQAALQYLAFAQDAGERMVRMLDDLVAYTNVDNKEPKTYVDLAEIICEVQANLADKMIRTGAIIRLGNLPEVEGYRTQLVQLFQNFLSNALKFSTPGKPPRINIYTSRCSGETIEIAIADNGTGIPPDKLKSIFDLFNRAGLGEESEGSGVGLALCLRIAKAHGAQIRVTSIQAEGSTFYVEFSRAKLPEAAHVHPALVLADEFIDS